MGFILQIESGLPKELDDAAKSHYDKMIDYMDKKSAYETYFKTGYVNSQSYYRRGILGLRLVKPNELFFRRTHKNKRIYGCVQPKHFVQLDGSPIDFNQCMCAEHLAGTRVRYVERPEMYTYWSYA